MLIGTMVACGTNWAMTPATGVPCPASVLARMVLPPPAAARTTARTTACATACATTSATGGRTYRSRGEVLVAQAAGEDLVPGATRPRNEGTAGVDTGVNHGDGTILPVIRHAQCAQVVQADQRAARRVGQVGGRLELPDPVVVRSVERRPIRREADGQRRVDEAGVVLGPAGVESIGERIHRSVGQNADDPAAEVVGPNSRVAVG